MLVLITNVSTLSKNNPASACIASGTSSSNVFWCGHDAVSKTTYAIGNVFVRGVFFYFLFFLIIQREEHKAILYLRKMLHQPC